jgi:PAS domain S-box-containing protein
MRDDHRPKQELLQEIISLRKQVLDLKEAMTVRRRVEEALRTAEARLRALTDTAPVGLCIFRQDGTLITANRPFARMLGYDSPAELQAVGEVLGVFASPEEQSRTLGSSSAPGSVREARFRRKDGCGLTQQVLRAESDELEAFTLAVFRVNLNHSHPAFPTTPA